MAQIPQNKKDWKKKGGTVRIKVLIYVIFLSVGFVLIHDDCESGVPDIVVRQRLASVTIYVNDADSKGNITGSGFIIDPSGIVVTNHHVISKWLEDWTTNILVKMENGSYLSVENVLAYDESNDIALLKTAGRKLPVTKLSKAYNVMQGIDVYAIGSPRGLETTVSNGVVSSVRGKDELIQITAPISPGSSGGPVFNSHGEVIGVATFSFQDSQNLNFAIPVRYVKDLLEEYKRRTPIEGFWKTSTGTTLKTETEGGQLTCHIYRPSEVDVKLDYKTHDIVFSGKLRGLNLRGFFTQRYSPPFDRCYPEGRAIEAEGYFTPDGTIFRMKFQYISINQSCKDIATREIINVFNKLK